MTGGFVRGIMGIVLVCGATAGSLRAAEPNEDFANATVLGPTVRSVSDNLFTGDFPDTILGAFNPGGGLIGFDDDDSTVGDGRASGLFDVPVNADGSIILTVSGFGDDDFIGFHTESGPYDLFLDVFDSQGFQIDALVGAGALAAGLKDDFFVSDPAYVGGTFIAEIDNTVAGGSDVDFWRFTGLPAGLPFVAEVTVGDLDTVLGWFDEAGELVLFDDDGGQGVLSRLSDTLPVNGELVLAVTGFPDSDFVGVHGESGDYTLDVAVLLPGDANKDGQVTGADLISVQQNFGGVGPTPLLGDANHDGQVTGADLISVQQNFGGVLTPAGSSIPEPGMLLVWLIACAGSLKRPRLVG